MTKSFHKNRFYSWYTIAAFINLIIAGLGARDIRFLTLAIVILTAFIIFDLKAYIARQLAKNELSKEVGI